MASRSFASHSRRVGALNRRCTRRPVAGSRKSYLPYQLVPRGPVRFSTLPRITSTPFEGRQPSELGLKVILGVVGHNARAILSIRNQHLATPCLLEPKWSIPFGRTRILCVHQESSNSCLWGCF